MTGGSTGPDGGIKKKMRKGTHSCFECRRRKIRCIFSPENQNVCNECFARGSKCIDQENAESDVVLDHRKNLRERVAKLESLVDALLDDKSDRNSAAEALKKLGASMPPTPVSNPSYSTDSPRAPLTVPERVDSNSRDAPILSLFDNAVISRVESKLSALTGGSPGMSRSCVDTPSADAWNTVEEDVADPVRDEAKNERIRAALLKMLPPMDSLVQIVRSNDPYWSMLNHKCPKIVSESKTFEAFATQVLSASPKINPCRVATLVVAVAACVPDSGEALDVALDGVERCITSDDDYMSTIDGLECAMLQAKSYSDIGQAKKSWRIFRRALNNAQLMGLPRNHSFSPTAEGIFWTLFMGDRMMSLMLGVPYALQESHIDMRLGGKDLWECTGPEAFMYKSASVAGRVIDRMLSSKPSSVAEVLDLDAQLDKIAQAEDAAFWTVAPGASITNADELVNWQVQILQQMCFHQVRMYLHMPFMLQSATNSRYEYSRKTCLEAARELLRLYHTLRHAGYAVYQCKVVDFIAFTADIVLFLGLLGYGRLSAGHNPEQDEADWKVIETSIETLKIAATEKGGKVAEQSYNVLKMFYGVRHMETKSSEIDSTCVTKVVVPYFGTLAVRPGHKFHHVPAGAAARPASTTPSSTTGSSFQGQSSSSATSPTNGSNASPYSHHHASFSTQGGSGGGPPSMDPFLAYDAGFYMPSNGGMFDASQFSDEPLANYMPTPSGSSVASGLSMGPPSGGAVAPGGIHTNAKGDGSMTGGFGSFPWGMASMDIDQDWSWFMNEAQTVQPAAQPGPIGPGTGSMASGGGGSNSGTAGMSGVHTSVLP